MKWLLLLAASLQLASPEDLKSVQTEPNLERRSERALDHASEVLTNLRPDLETKEWSKVAIELADFRAAVDLCLDSLKSTGKSARRSPKYFKKAEVRLRELGRRLKGLQQLLPVDDRTKMDDLMDYVDKVQDDLVNLTMGVR